MIELLCLVLLELEWLVKDNVVGWVGSTDCFYENVGHIICGALLCLMGCVAREPYTVQWDRVEEGRGPVKICVYFNGFLKKKLNVTEGGCGCLITTRRA